MRSIKSSLVGLALAGILALAPTAAFALAVDSGFMTRRGTGTIPTTGMIIPIMATMPATIPRPLLPCRRS